MNDPVVLSFAFVYLFAALATIVATFGFKPDSNRSMQMSPVRIRNDRPRNNSDKRQQ